MAEKVEIARSRKPIFDGTITLGHIGTMASMLLTAIVFAITIQANVNSLQQKSETQQSQIVALTEIVNNLTNRVTVLETVMDTVTNALGQINTGLDTANNRLTAVQLSVAGIVARFGPPTQEAPF